MAQPRFTSGGGGGGTDDNNGDSDNGNDDDSDSQSSSSGGGSSGGRTSGRRTSGRSGGSSGGSSSPDPEPEPEPEPEPDTTSSPTGDQRLDASSGGQPAPPDGSGDDTTSSGDSSTDSGGGADQRLDAPGGQSRTDNNTVDPDAADQTTSPAGGTKNPDPETSEDTDMGGGQPTVVTADGAPSTDSTIVQRRLTQASQALIENNDVLDDRSDFQLRVTDTGSVEYAGLTDSGREDAIEQNYLERGAESVEAEIGEETTVSGRAGDRLIADQTPGVATEETVDVSVDWGEQPDSVDAPGGEHEMTSGEDSGYSVGSDEFEEAAIEARLERDTDADLSVEKQDDGEFAVSQEFEDTPDGRVSTPGDGPDLRNQSSEGLPDVEDRLEAQVARDMDGVSADDVTVTRQEEGMVAPEAERGRDTAQFTVTLDEQPDTREIEQDSLSGVVSGFEDATGLNVPGDGPLAETARTDEQFGDMDLSFGLGGEGDKVEQFADTVAQSVNEGATDVAQTLFENENSGDPTIATRALEAATSGPGQRFLDLSTDIADSQSRDIEGLDAAKQASSTFTERTSNVGQGLITGPANLLGGVPKLAVEGTEAAAFTATNPGTTAARVPDAVATRAVTATEAGLDNPGQTVGALVGSAAFSGGLFKATQGTRAGTAARVALQPGEELVKAGIRRGALGSRAAQVTPGVRMGQVDGGTSSGGGSSVTSGLAERIGEFRQEVSQRTPNVRIDRDPDAGRLEIEPAARAQVASEVRKARRSITDTPGQIANRLESGAESAVQRTRELDAQLGAQAAVTGRALGERASSLRDRSPTQAARDLASGAESRVEMGARRTARDLGETATDTRIGAQFRAGEAAERARQTPDRARQTVERTRRQAGDLPADIGLTIARARGELASRLPDRPSIEGDSTSTSDVFGRPRRTGEALDDLDIDVSDEVDLGRPLSTDLDATPLSQRLADATPDGLPSRPNLNPRGLTVRVEASRPQRLYTPEGEGQPMTSGVVDVDGGFAIETEGEVDTSSPGETGQLSRIRGEREMQDTQVEGQEAVVRTQMEAERDIEIERETEAEAETGVDTVTRPEVRAGVAGGLAGAASEPTLDDPATSEFTGGDVGVDSEFDAAEVTEPSVDAGEAATPFEGNDVDVEPDLDTEFGFEPDTTADTTTDTELSQDLDTELDQELERELEQELESEMERESEAEAVLFEEEERRDTERDAPASPFDEDLYDTGIADVEDLENREL